MSAASGARAPRRPLVAVLQKRGRFVTAAPVFEPGRSLTVERDHRAGW